MQKTILEQLRLENRFYNLCGIRYRDQMSDKSRQVLKREVKTRRCLKCREDFRSAENHRLCYDCRRKNKQFRTNNAVVLKGV